MSKRAIEACAPWFSTEDVYITEIDDQQRAQELYASRASATWGAGVPLEGTDFVYLARYSPEDSDRRLSKPEVVVCHKKLLEVTEAEASITFHVWGEHENYAEVSAFVGPQKKCEVCGGYGEYETGHGPAGCMPCNSRLFFFEDFLGHRVGADDGDVIERHSNGLHLVQKHLHD